LGESTHFPGRNDPGRIDPGRTGNRGETTRIPLQYTEDSSCFFYKKKYNIYWGLHVNTICFCCLSIKLSCIDIDLYNNVICGSLVVFLGYATWYQDISGPGHHGTEHMRHLGTRYWTSRYWKFRYWIIKIIWLNLKTF
jgi:hypothetical protein